MGTYINDGMVSIPSSHEFGATTDILKELGALLAVGRRADGRRYVADMCQAESINQWAKYKPEAHSSTGNLTLAQRKTNNYGFAITNHTTPLALKTAMAADATQMNGWAYKKPTGATSAPNRIRDFHGYNHNATRIIGQYVPALNARNDTATAKAQWSMIVKPYESDDSELTLADFNLSSYYFGIALINKAGEVATIATADSNLASASTTVTITTGGGNVLAGTYTSVPFLTPNKIAQGGTQTSSILYGVPGLYLSELKVVSDVVSISGTARKGLALVGASSQPVQITLAILNQSGSSLTFTSGWVRVVFSGKDIDAAYDYSAGERQTTLPDFTVPSADDPYYYPKDYYASTGITSDLSYITINMPTSVNLDNMVVQVKLGQYSTELAIISSTLGGGGTITI